MSEQNYDIVSYDTKEITDLSGKFISLRIVKLEYVRNVKDEV